MRYGSLFSGIGGFDLFQFVSHTRLEVDQILPHQGNGDFFELLMPKGMLLTIANRKIFGPIISLVEIDVMNTLAFLKRSADFLGNNFDVFGYIPFPGCVRMIGSVYVPVSVIFDIRPSCDNRLKKSTTTPVVVRFHPLISWNRAASGDTHLDHGAPYNLLRCTKFFGNLSLRHALLYVAVIKLFIRKWHAVSVFVRHCNLLSANASNYTSKQEIIRC